MQQSKLLVFVRYLVLLCSIILLANCASNDKTFILKNEMMLSEQHPNTHFEQEVMIVRISQMLLIGRVSDKERASLYFERGVLYDSLGLWALARYDFTQALALQPKMASIYNYLGLYLLLDEDYDGASEAFNALIGLDSEYEYAHFNRGLNFYYANRYSLAEKDLLTFYEGDKTDPYRVLWLYFNELKFDAKNALVNLRKRYVGLSKDYWGTNIIQYYLGELSVEELQKKAQGFAQSTSSKYAEILTETYFYLAKQQLNMGELNKAEALFKLAVANQVYNFVEYRFALLELARLKRFQNK
ncbi:lipoprotein NlpI-like protein [Bisgaardia hudsonensis]|nr:lipoprotein NlpI-like protein [Bisgaardia hudsonensis]